MPLNLGVLQADYNTAKASLATLQAAVDAADAAMFTLEQNCQTLEADGASGIAAWFRQAAALTSEGYQTFGNCTKIVLYPRNPNIPRDPSAASSIGPITACDGYKSIQQASGFAIVP
jgi:hypothetical protein